VIEVSADQLKYFSYNKRTYLIGNVQLSRDRDVIKAEKVELDNELNVLYINNDFKIEGEEYIVSANRMVISIDEDISELFGEVSVLRPAETMVGDNVDPREAKIRQSDTFITGDYLKQIELPGDLVQTIVSGNVVIRQKDKLLTGDFAIFEKEKEFQMLGNVEVELEGVEWAVKPEQRESFKNEDVKERLMRSVFLKGDVLSVDLETNTTVLRDNVLLIQEETRSTCKLLKFDDEQSELILYQDVVIRKGEQERLMADAVVTQVEDESFWTLQIPKAEEESQYLSSFIVHEFFSLNEDYAFSLEGHPDWMSIDANDFLIGEVPQGAEKESPYQFQIKAIREDGKAFFHEFFLLISQKGSGELLETAQKKESIPSLDQPEIQFVVED